MARVRLSRGAPAGWALNAALAAGALALYLEVGAIPAPAAAVHIPWWGLAIAFALTEAAVVHVHFRRGAHTLTLAELPLALGLLLAAPGDVVLGWVAGAGLMLALSRGLPAVRRIFNLAQLGVTAGVAALLFHAVSGSVGLAGLLSMALDAFRGEVAEVCLFPATGDGAGTLLAVGTADRLEVMQPLEPRVARELAELIAADRPHG